MWVTCHLIPPCLGSLEAEGIPSSRTKTLLPGWPQALLWFLPSLPACPSTPCRGSMHSSFPDACSFLLSMSKHADQLTNFLPTNSQVQVMKRSSLCVPRLLQAHIDPFYTDESMPFMGLSSLMICSAAFAPIQ